MPPLRCLALLVILAACTPTAAPTTTTGHTPGTVQVRVDRVIDGDTFEAGGDRYRLEGINAPDMGECAYEEARDRLAEAIEGATIGIVPTGTDQFGRTLAVVESPTRANLDLVASGLAIATTADGGVPSELLSAEEEARDAGLGMWDDCGATGEIPPVSIIGVDANPPGPDEDALDGETVTIRNDGGSPVDLSGWMLRDESSVHRFTFPEGTVLAPGESITVTSADRGWSPGDSPVWNNGGDMALLLDGDGRVVDRFRY